MFRSCIHLVVLVGLAAPALAQQPNTTLLPSALVDRFTAPPVDVPALLAEDDKRVEPGPLRVAAPHELDVTPLSAGTWEDLPSGHLVWRYVLESPGALWMVLGLDRFTLPDGARLTLLDRAGNKLVTYTAADEKPHGQLWTLPYETDRFELRLLLPGTTDPSEVDLHLTRLTHGYRPVGSVGTGIHSHGVGGSGDCNIDVACPEADLWQDQTRGIVLILVGGGEVCSGSLVNNTSNDCRNLMLSAEHCFSPADAATTSLQFHYRRPDCGAGDPGPAQLAGGGANFLATYAPSDFYLIEMIDEIPVEFDVHYNGWSRSTDPGTESTGIHHPDLDTMKWSFNADTLVDDGTHWRVTEWEEGTTEPGSSGSALFDQNQRIVGQLTGGLASCFATDEYDIYGKISTSWDGGGAADSRLSDHLDAAGTGAETVDGIDAAACRTPAARLRYQAHAIDDSMGNGDGIVDPDETFLVLIDVENRGSLDASSVVGTLTTMTPEVEVVAPDGTWPDIVSETGARSDDPHFLVRTTPDFVCGSLIEFGLELNATEAEGPVTNGFDQESGTLVVTVRDLDDLESGIGGWTTESLQGGGAWELSTADSSSPMTSWFVPDQDATNDQVLVMPALTDIIAGQLLVFSHRVASEGGWDGGALEYSADGGGWNDANALILTGGYNGALDDGPLGGRPAWTGTIAWSDVEVDLTSLVGSSVQFRWRFSSDGSVPAEGWYVDDIRREQRSFECDQDPPPGEVSDPRGGGSPFRIAKIPIGYELSWSEPPAGGLVSSYRLYRTPLASPAAPACEVDLGSGLSFPLAVLSDDSAFLVVAVGAGGLEGPTGRTSAGTDRSGAVAPCP
ncbi:MAG: hypothetical protein AAF533_26635 [Acidobacteriota bacterium]